MTENDVRKLVAGGHQPEIYIWRVDSDDGPSQWAAVVDDEDLSNDDGSRRQFANHAEPTMLFAKMGVKKILYQGAEMKVSFGSGPNAIPIEEIDGLTDEAIEENLKLIKFKPPK